MQTRSRVVQMREGALLACVAALHLGLLAAFKTCGVAPPPTQFLAVELTPAASPATPQEPQPRVHTAIMPTLAPPPLQPQHYLPPRAQRHITTTRRAQPPAQSPRPAVPTQVLPSAPADPARAVPAPARGLVATGHALAASSAISADPHALRQAVAAVDQPGRLGDLATSRKAPASATAGEGGARTSDGSAEPAVDTQALLAAYSAAVSRRIREQQSYPGRAQVEGREGSVKVSFTLTADGSLTDAAVVTGSGEADLDAAGLAAIHQAAPFAPIPPALHRNTAHLSITLRFYLK